MRRVYPLLFFALVVALAFWKVIFHHEFTLLSGSDTATAYFPWFDIAAYWLKKGVFLLWDPYVYAGKFNMGEPQAGIYYPLNWLFMLLPGKDGGASTDGFQALLILDYFLAGVFLYRYSRSIGLSPYGAATAGTAWAFGGFTAQLYGYANVLSGFVWLPLVLLYHRRAALAQTSVRRLRSVLAAGLFLALSFLPGHHIPPIHIGLLLILYTCFSTIVRWKDAGARGAAVLVSCGAGVAATAALVTAFQWIPSAEWARGVYRWVGEGPPVTWGQEVPYSILQKTSMLSPQDAASLLFPYVSTNANIYTGFVLVFLALVGLLFARAIDSRFFAVGTVFYFLASWGQFSALHGWVNTFVPGMWFAREVFYYLVPFQLCLAMLAGWGIDTIVNAHQAESPPGLDRFLARTGWGIAVAVLGFGGLSVALRLLRDMRMDHPYLQAAAGFAVFAGLFGLLLFFFHTQRMGAGLFRVLVLGLVVVDLASHVSVDVRTKMLPEGQENHYVREFWRKPPAARYMLELRAREYFRCDDPSGVFPPNYGDVWRLEATMGHGATALVSYLNFRGTGWGPATNASALLNTRYFVSREPVRGMERVWGEGEAVYHNPRAVPRAFSAQRFRQFATRDEVLGWLPTPLMAPRETVLLTSDELSRVPLEIRRGLVDEDDGLAVRVLSYRRRDEERVKESVDDAERQRLATFHAAWGWSAGDEVEFSARPATALEHSFLVLVAAPSGPAASRLTVEKQCGDAVESIPVEIPGVGPASGSPQFRTVAADLGALDAAECRIKLSIPEGFGARIDSLRLSRSFGDGEASSPGPVEVTSFRPNQLRLAANLSRPAIVVLSELWYPGWEAVVDGQPTPLLRADAVLRAVPVPEGRHEIIVRFRPGSFFVGLWIAGVSLLAITLFLLATRRRSDGSGD